MKNQLTKSIYVLLLTLSTAVSFAQKVLVQKTALFNKYPTQIKCTQAELERFFASSTEESIKTSFANTLNINGIITNRAIKSNNLHSVTVKLPEFDNAILSITKRFDANNNPIYVGHIINPNSTDAYELKRTADNNYQLVKISLESILPTCAQL